MTEKPLISKELKIIDEAWFPAKYRLSKIWYPKILRLNHIIKEKNWRTINKICSISIVERTWNKLASISTGK